MNVSCRSVMSLHAMYHCSVINSKSSAVVVGSGGTCIQRGAKSVAIILTKICDVAYD